MTQSYAYLTPQGLIIADTSATLATVQSWWKQALGADLVVDPSTPQGVFITTEAIALNGTLNNNAAVGSQINPNYSGGVMLDAILALTGGERQLGSPTSVTNATLTGVADTFIPQGAQARTGASGDLFETTADVTLDGSGNGSVDFQSTTNGPIACADGALNTIVTAILGWETVTNNQGGTPASVTTLGTVTQGDQGARAFRQNTLAFNGISLAEAITSALYNVTGVRSLFFQENVSNSTQTINDISMISHSVYACVQGGTNTDVAACLLENKSSGAAWVGSTTVNVTEPASGQVYAVKFDRPEELAILVQVTTANGNADQVRQAVLDYAAGLISVTNQSGSNGTYPGFTVGSDVSPFDIAGAIMAEIPGIYIQNLEIGLSPSGPLSNSPIAVGVNQIATITLNDISIVVP